MYHKLAQDMENNSNLEHQDANVNFCVEVVNSKQPAITQTHRKTMAKYAVDIQKEKVQAIKVKEPKKTPTPDKVQMISVNILPKKSKLTMFLNKKQNTDSPLKKQKTEVEVP